MRGTKKHIGSWCDFEMSKKKVFQTNFDSDGLNQNEFHREITAVSEYYFQVTLPCVIVIFT